MMTSVSGVRGVGKTYHLSKEVYKRYKRSFFTITNFSHVYSSLDISREKPDYLFDLIKQLGIFKERGFEMVDLDPRYYHSGVFMAIDEAHLYFSADLYKRYSNDDQFQYILKFLSQARKADIEIWLSTQDPAKIDKNWRRYTEEYIRFRPVIPLSYKKFILVERPRRSDGTVPLPYYRREVRYPIPLVWREYHVLDSDNPTFNYSTVTDENGFVSLSPKSTLVKRGLPVLSGWLDPFPYKLYDSYQMLAMQEDGSEQDFGALKDYAYIKHTYQRERWPTLKKFFRMRARDAELPTKQKRTNVELKDPDPSEKNNSKIYKQPIEFLDDLAFFNQFSKSGKLHSRKQLLYSFGNVQKPKEPTPGAASTSVLAPGVLDSDVSSVTVE